MCAGRCRSVYRPHHQCCNNTNMALHDFVLSSAVTAHAFQLLADRICHANSHYTVCCCAWGGGRRSHGSVRAGPVFCCVSAAMCLLRVATCIQQPYLYERARDVARTQPQELGWTCFAAVGQQRLKLNLFDSFGNKICASGKVSVWGRGRCKYSNVYANVHVCIFVSVYACAFEMDGL